MNIMKLIIPKSMTSFLEEDFTLRQGLEKMKYHGYAAIPVIDDKGHYQGTVTEGDFLWALYNNNNPDIKKLEKTQLRTIVRKDYQPISASASMDEILNRAYSQNFVPVVDDREVFIGIIRRKDIIKHLASIQVEL